LSILWTVQNLSLAHLGTMQSLQNQFVKEVAIDGVGYTPSHLTDYNVYPQPPPLTKLFTNAKQNN